MVDVGSSNSMGHSLAAPTVPRVSWGQKFDALLQRFFDGLMSCLCRASRGYLCPPDMPSLMYPDDPKASETRMDNARVPGSRVKECCDEKLSGK